MYRFNVRHPPFEFEQKELNYLSPEERKKIIRNYLLRILKENSSTGVTISQLSKITKFDKRTILKHLEFLCAIREVYKVDLGSTSLYFPNGEVIHKAREDDLQIGDRTYSFLLIKNPFGEFLYIQEKIRDEYNSVAVNGGLIVPVEYVYDFIEKIQKVMRDVYEKS